MTAAISMMQPFYPTHDEEGKYYGYTYGLYNPLALADKLGNQIIIQVMISHSHLWE